MERALLTIRRAATLTRTPPPQRLVGLLHERDFGYAFMDPVGVQDYDAVVEAPVSFADVLHRLKKSYLHIEGDGGRAATVSESVAFALKDLNLIYLNCMRFNFEGSAVYKMSVVQQKMLKKLVDFNFGEKVVDKKVLWEVDRFVEEQIQDRKDYDVKLAAWKKKVSEVHYRVLCP